MKIPKIRRTYCPFCKKHTEHKVSESKKKARNAAHPMSYGSIKRVRARGLRRGAGNQGRYSRPTKPKMTGKKLSKKTDFRYTCKECKKTHAQKDGFRAKRVELV